MNSNSFIRNTAVTIAKANQLKDIENSIFVFPNRRAGLFFQKELSLALHNTPFFLPEVYDINHFAESLSSYRKADEIELLLYLHKAYRDTYNDVSQASLPLRSFVELGLKMLHDFDEIDKYLVDAHTLFLNVYQLNELTATMELTPEQQEAINRFCNIVNRNSKQEDESLDFHRKYASLWNHITLIYDHFNAILDEQKAAYEGKIYRDVCNNISDAELPQKPIYFIGFNILTTSEEMLIHRFEQLNRATLIFDYNQLKRTTAKFDYHHDISDFDFNIPTSIHDYPSMTAGEQAENLNNILIKLITENSAQAIEQNTAIVLADESLLMPTLHSIPSDIKHLNITMGYPLSDTPIATFIASLIQFQVNIQTDRTGKQTIYHHYLMELLLHPYSHIVCQQNNRVNPLISRIRKENILHIPLSELTECHPTLFLYTENIFAYVLSILDILDKHFLEQGDKYLDIEFIRQYRDRLTQLETILTRTNTTVDRSELTILIRRITRNLKVQFRGEPLRGLQIMGLLECRLLDFDNIIFVGFNDQFVPGNGLTDITLIPYSLRKAYKLPSHEITNLIYSYNFYRMLHRCKSLHLIYNLSTSDNSKNEVSRFHHQLHYLKEQNIEHHTKTATLSNYAPSTYFPEIAPIKEFALSASSLKHFITCPLHFYYSKLLNISEPDQIDETMQDSTFGSLLHKIMELHYKNTNKTSFDNICLEAYREVCHHSYDAHGYDIIAFESAKTMARNIIRYDETQRAPFTVFDTEHHFKTPYKNLTLNGVIDRIDNENAETGSTWVIDYKTSGSNETPDINRMFSSEKAKNIDLETLQILFYCYALKKNYHHLNAQLYKVYSISKNSGLSPAIKYSDIAPTFEPLLEKTLDRLIEYLGNPILFKQHAANTENCKYCPFGNLCAK